MQLGDDHVDVGEDASQRSPGNVAAWVHRRSGLAAGPQAVRLPHAGVSWRLNSGVPGPKVAEWAGHSVEILYRV
jgi:hypothetical protein